MSPFPQPKEKGCGQTANKEQTDEDIALPRARDQPQPLVAIIEYTAKEQEVGYEANKTCDHQRIKGLVVGTIRGGSTSFNVSKVRRIEAIVCSEH